MNWLKFDVYRNLSSVCSIPLTLSVFASGFAENQFNHEQAELGNTVTLLSLSRTRAVPCDVIPYYSTPSQIVCDTR